MARRSFHLLSPLIVLGLAGVAHASTPVAAGSVVDDMPIALSIVRVALLAALFFSAVASFKIPGTGVAEAAYVVLASALLVPAVLSGEAQWYEVVAILVGTALVAIEIFLIPGFGMTGVLGGILLVAGAVLVFVPDPRLVALRVDDVRDALLVLIGGTIGGFALIAALGRFLPNLPRANRLVLRETLAPLAFDVAWPVVGDVGVCATDLKPGGVIRPTAADDADDVSVVCDRGYVPRGARVEVVAIVGTQVTVRPVVRPVTRTTSLTTTA